MKYIKYFKVMFNELLIKNFWVNYGKSKQYSFNQLSKLLESSPTQKYIKHKFSKQMATILI